MNSSSSSPRESTCMRICTASWWTGWEINPAGETKIYIPVPTKKLWPSQIRSSVCAVLCWDKTKCWSELHFKQSSLWMWDSLRLHLETICSPSLFLSLFLSLQYAFLLGFTIQYHKQLYEHGAGITHVPGAGEKKGCLSWCCHQQKCLWNQGQVIR